MSLVEQQQGEQRHYEFKIVLLGDRGVGKTCLVLRFIEGLYNSRQQSTIGAFFLTKKIVTSNGDACKIQIWDTAGQERFRAMAPMYYRNAAAAIVCFDVTDESTFNTMKDWVEELKTNVVDKNLVIAIACNKADLDTRQVSRARAESFARSIDAIILDTSAKENFGVSELFTAVSEQVITLRGHELEAQSNNNRGKGGATSRGINLANRPPPKNDDRSSCAC
uniref:Uncharacterized protein n=1 Tax=Aureoumbra lagunensis TaxID=44058 RepID=A0A7S3NK22_9STRA|mmetsp:Transcript_19225/g.24947  ORF Transcript_19225/g.24947 Transcript_19225/m.24947 type:complete len:222 (+) Transcript_19225:36-701(+)